VKPDAVQIGGLQGLFAAAAAGKDSGAVLKALPKGEAELRAVARLVDVGGQRRRWKEARLRVWIAEEVWRRQHRYDCFLRQT